MLQSKVADVYLNVMGGRIQPNKQYAVYENFLSEKRCIYVVQQENFAWRGVLWC